MLELDFSDWGKDLKASHRWLRLRDASTARSILSTIATGLLSFTVFSFSMVMILLTQAASQLSNRILANLIGKRFQQAILGCYIGTILYALFLLTAIRDIDSGIHIPALSIYLLILFTIADVFLFIYFLTYVTQSVRYETVISDILSKTESALTALSSGCSRTDSESEDRPATTLLSPVSEYYQGFDQAGLVQVATRAGVDVRLLHPVGTYLLKGAPFIEVRSAVSLSTKEEDALLSSFDFYTGQSPDAHYLYGFRQLTEMALRALSPGINDPATAVQALHALAHLLLLRMSTPVRNFLTDAEGRLRVETCEPAVTVLVEDFFWPIWDYGKGDRILRAAMRPMLTQLINSASSTDLVPFRQLLHAVGKEATVATG